MFGLGKKLLIYYAYNSLKSFSSQHDEVFAIPCKKIWKVGMSY